MKKTQIIFLIILITALSFAFFLSGIYTKSDIVKIANESTQNITFITQESINDLPQIVLITRKIHINATVYKNSSTLPIYRGYFGKNDSINQQLQQIGKDRENVTSEKDAPEAAQKALEPYGGLPKDAVYNGAQTVYAEEYNHELHKVTAKWPQFTTVSFSREFNNMQVRGDGNVIILTLGTDGELLRIYKIWRNYTYTEDVPIIPVEKAIEKLEREELVDSTWHPEEAPVTIDSIDQAYFARNISSTEAVLEPLWMFLGYGNSNYRLGFFVYARQFANFTAIPTSGIAPLKARFIDTSDTTPWKWRWDFGDNTNSTDQNPVHIYEKPGNYTVNLTVWNDMGSDILSKNSLITVSSGIPENNSIRTGTVNPSVKSTGST